MPDKLQLLERYWHYKQFRPCQEEIIDSVLQGRDTLALLPTGGGKSLCYQLPALLKEGLCLVVSPLIALMKDQVQNLNVRRLPAACLYGGMSGSEITAVLTNAMAGKYKFLYVSPERLKSRMFIEHYRHMKVSLIAVDEAHCVSQWGYDFRPPYLQIAAIRQYHPFATMVALTATATPQVVDDIRVRLELRQCHVVRGSFVRDNLAYIVTHTGDKYNRLLRLCQSCSEGSGIVYVGSRRGTEAVAAFLTENGVSAGFYHAGMSAAERDARQADWMQGRCRVMVATNAFGMGIDKADVRFVVHLDVPASVEAYFQEAGRAGRDGMPAKAVLLCDDGDRRRMEDNYNVGYPDIKHIRNAYRALCNYYRIPMGSGEGLRFDFKLKEIAETYNMALRELYSCCRYLEREGLISLYEDDMTQSQLFIPLGRDELYRFQVDHMRMGDLLQTTIRLYPGLFTSAVPIDEKRIASRSLVDVKEVRTMLTKMNDMHVVEYRKSSDKPQVTFCIERVDESTISLGEQNYLALKAAARGRMEAMLRYIDNNDMCRSRQLTAYFGETDGVGECGMCDVCLSRRDDADVEQAVRQAIAGGRMTIGDLCATLADHNYIGVEGVVREMLDRGELQLDRNLFLSLS